ncbi:hypothetical protein [Lapidilactobacillus gannanensis]|uniref:Maltodextrose utilization protein MalA n=1 Tax=Lapidilactobacillus gannanensis TaxID=2486002 RepID=A0ABW4BRH1_9LACO|nr:hypothetical protein [Lapidilactobacillus gannanensis]
MKKVAFPVRYFMSAITPKAMFKGRRALNWLQMIIIFIFLNALMILPIPMFYAQQQTFNFHAFLPTSTSLLSRPELKQAAKSFRFDDNKLQNDQTQIIYQTKNTIIGINLSSKQLHQKKSALNLQKTQFIIQEQSRQFPAAYQVTDQVDPQRQITKFLKASWYRSNRGTIVMLMMFSVGLIVVGSNLLLVLGAAFFISLMKRNPKTSVKGFKEAMNITLNASFYGIIAAMFVGFIRFDFTLMFTIYSVFLALSVLAIYWRTRFSDQFIS